VISFGERPAFTGFGDSFLAPGCDLPSAEIVLEPDSRQWARLVRRDVPALPGVYGMVDGQGELIYVGESKSLRDRLLGHVSARSGQGKSRRILAGTRRLVWEPAPHEFLALLRELELIRRWRPRLNVKGQPGRRRRAYVVLGRGPAPMACLTPSPARDDRAVFGPVRSTRENRRAVRAINDLFGLRDCKPNMPIVFSDQQELFPGQHAARCMRHALGTCLSPCSAACSSRQYAERVRAARRFLGGAGRSVLGQLTCAMRVAAGQQRFEEAAVLRDAHQTLDLLADQLRRLRIARRRYSFVYSLPGYGGGELWCLVRHGQVAATVRAPQGPVESAACLSLLEQVFPAARASVAQAPPEDHDVTLLVSLWFRRHPEERKRTLLPAEAATLLAGAVAPVAG